MTSIQVYNEDADLLNALSIKMGITVASVIEKLIREYGRTETKDECDTQNTNGDTN